MLHNHNHRHNHHYHCSHHCYQCGITYCCTCSEEWGRSNWIGGGSIVNIPNGMGGGNFSLGGAGGGSYTAPSLTNQTSCRHSH